jgi:hypothetical protein
MFPRSTWLDLTEQAGFDVETSPFVEADYGRELVLPVGRLSS